MIRLEDRLITAQNIERARRAGARLKTACQIARVDPRTLQRWQNGEGLKSGDGRPRAIRPVSAHALSEAERQRIVQVANEPRFAELPPARIVPMLADEGTYIASESSFSRVLRAYGQVRHRGRSKHHSECVRRARMSPRHRDNCGVGTSRSWRARLWASGSICTSFWTYTAERS
jgi:putative transposase